MDKFTDLYTDYLIGSTSLVTATGLSMLSQGSISHDKVTRFLKNGDFDSRSLWKEVKPIYEEIC